MNEIIMILRDFYKKYARFYRLLLLLL